MPRRTAKRKRTVSVQAMLESFVNGLAEEEEQARKVQRTSKHGRRDMTKREEQWGTRLEVCKEWKGTKGRFPKANKKDKEENSLYNWLRNCKPGGRSWTQARWEKLNEAFGEGWEKECFPYAW